MGKYHMVVEVEGEDITSENEAKACFWACVNQDILYEEDIIEVKKID